jgi:hypothetical protein
MRELERKRLALRQREVYQQEQRRQAAKERRAVMKKERSLRRARVFHTATFLAALFVFGALSLTLPKPENSVVEKRELATMPTFSTDALVEGSYTRDLELYYADTFPFRELFVTAAARIDELKGIRYDGVRIHAAPVQEATVPVTEPTVPPPTKPTEKPTGPTEATEPVTEKPTPPPVVDNGESGEKVGAVFVYQNKAMSMFGADDSLGEWYANTLSAYQEAWGDSVRVFNVIVPTAIEFALPERYRDVSVPQGPKIQHVYDTLDERIIPVDAHSEIALHADEYVYFNSDHHWTGLGAYYAYRAFCEAAGVVPLELEQYEKRTLPSFRGSLFAQTNDAALAEDYVDYYIVPVGITDVVRYDQGAPDYPVPHSIWADYATGGNSYSVYLHGDFPLIHAKTDVNNGKKALVVKESFGNAFAPYLLAHYEELYIVDQRYFLPNLVTFVQDNGVDDVIFINNAFAAYTPYHIEKIAGMMTDRRYLATMPTEAPTEEETEEETEPERPKEQQ